MDLRNKGLAVLERLGGPLLSRIYRRAKRIPWVRRQIEREYAEIMASLEESLKPYREDFGTCKQLPKKGRPRQEVLEEMEALAAREEGAWKEGYVSGAVYHGDDSFVEFLNRIYSLNSQVNSLHTDLWPRSAKFDSEIVAMTSVMLGAGQDERDPAQDICGTVTSGGTESILLAMKAYRDQARERRRIGRPNMVVPVTAHAAFDKAAQYFNIEIRHVEVGPDCRARVKSMKRAVDRNTIVMVGSAPAFPHGMVDPIEELSDLARARGIGLHTDACLGGFLLPWAEKLGYDVPAFDFRLPGVTSMSADTHKFGYAAKGTSVVLYRGSELRRYQYFTVTDWPGGMYFSPTFAGSRPGALSAVCWAAMVSMGEDGYLSSAGKILEKAARIKAGIRDIPELRVLGDPLFVIAFASDSLDIYRVLDVMRERGWNLNGLHRPACVHICVTLRHTQPGVADRFLGDLKDAVAATKANPKEDGGMAPVYGMAATIPVRGLVSDLLEKYMDLIYEV